MSAEERQDDLNAFEAALAALMPRTDRLDRDRLMFLAGQQSVLPSHFGRGAGGEGKKRLGAWPAAFAAMTVTAATLFLILMFGSERVGVDKVAKRAESDTLLIDNAKESTDAGKYADQSPWNRTIFDLAMLSDANGHKSNGSNPTYSYTKLLNQIINKGVDSWKPKTTGHYGKKTVVTPPLTNRELINQLIIQMEAEPG